MSETSAESEYRVLARKYRPSNFDDLIGQEPMVRTLTNAFASNRIAQAYMLTGVRGVGKTTTARILARALNYESDSTDHPTLDLTEPGNHCASIMEGNHVDVIEMDAASHTGIGDIREIIASVRYKPVSARYKVYIIDEVHMLSTAAFNGLLKTLEEPPEHVKFIFATTEIRKVPITVLSRCQRFDLRRIDAGELAEFLSGIADKEGVEVEQTALAMIARAAEGSVRDSLSLLDQAIAHAGGSGGDGDSGGGGESIDNSERGKVIADSVRSMLGLADRARVIDLFEYIMKGDISKALQEIKDQYDIGAEPAVVLTDLAEFVHFVTRVRYVDSALNDPSLSENEKTRGKAFSEQLSPRILGRAWQMLLKGIAEVQASPKPLAAADMVLVRITHAADLPTPDEVIRQLNDTSSSTPAPGSSPSPHSSGQPMAGSQAPSPALSTDRHNTNGGDGGSGGGGGGEGTTLRKTANGPTLIVDNQAQMLDSSEAYQRPVPKLVPVPDAPVSTPTKAEPAAAADVAADAAVADSIDSLSDLLAQAEKRRDIRFKLMLRNNFSEISFQHGRIEFHPVGNAPVDMAQILDARLRDWTGIQWEIIVAQATGSATIKEVETETRERNFAQAENDPVVAAVLKTFPKSRIMDVRFPGLESEDGLDVASAQEAALDNPDEFEADLDTAPGDNQNKDEPASDRDDPGAGGLDDYFR